MFNEYLSKAVEDIVAPLFNGTEFEIVEFRLRRQNETIVVDIMADRPKGGITLDECSVLNRKVSNQLEETNVLQGHYIVQVSSPGLDRPLKTAKDFQRVLERHVRFHLSEKVADKLEHAGNIKEVKEHGVVIQTKSGVMEIPLEKINKAVQIIE